MKVIEFKVVKKLKLLFLDSNKPQPACRCTHPLHGYVLICHRNCFTQKRGGFINLINWSAGASTTVPGICSVLNFSYLKSAKNFFFPLLIFCPNALWSFPGDLESNAREEGMGCLVLTAPFEATLHTSRHTNYCGEPVVLQNNHKCGSLQVT